MQIHTGWVSTCIAAVRCLEQPLRRGGIARVGYRLRDRCAGDSLLRLRIRGVACVLGITTLLPSYSSPAILYKRLTNRMDMRVATRSM